MMSADDLGAPFHTALHVDSSPDDFIPGRLACKLQPAPRHSRRVAVADPPDARPKSNARTVSSLRQEMHLGAFWHALSAVFSYGIQNSDQKVSFPVDALYDKQSQAMTKLLSCAGGWRRC